MTEFAFHPAIREGAHNKQERKYMDIIIEGKSLRAWLGVQEMDLISVFGWGDDKEYGKQFLRILLFQDKPALETGRVMLYVCPECADISCGAITAEIEDTGDRVIWKNFGYETDWEGLTITYPDMQPLEFNRQTYFSMLSAL